MLNQKVLPSLRGTGEIKTGWTNARFSTWTRPKNSPEEDRTERRMDRTEQDRSRTRRVQTSLIVAAEENF
jgi:hypothetical protein